jgi:NlpC/P60 family putative phage cell wall peptidase
MTTNNHEQIPEPRSLIPNPLIAAARECLGTPFHHQGRQPGIGLDCIGLIVVALQATGKQVHDRSDYGKRPDGKSLETALAAHGAVPVQDIAAGDILLFRYDGQPQHVALATGADSMIHSFAPAGEVVETLIGAYWRRRLVGIYRFR